MLRFAFAGAALLALAACGDGATTAETPVEATTAASAAAPPPIADAAVECMAYLALQAGAVRDHRGPGDVARLDAAAAAWRAEAAKHFSETELAQYFASSVAVLDDTEAGALQTEAARCVASAPTP